MLIKLNFADAPLFSRFEPSVIVQRTEAIVLLLDFAAKSPILAGSSAFAEFFKDGDRITFEEHVPLKMPDFQTADLDTSDQQSSHSTPASVNPYMAELMALQNEKETLLCVDQREDGEFVIRNEESALSSTSTVDRDAEAAIAEESADVHTFLVDAATLIAQAQSAENAGDYDVAFESYKCVIGILIEGAKEESNQVHAVAIKHKIHQYLKRAENIHRTHLINKAKNTKNYSLVS
jgi:hypothetical protein